MSSFGAEACCWHMISEFDRDLPRAVPGPPASIRRDGMTTAMPLIDDLGPERFCASSRRSRPCWSATIRPGCSTGAIPKAAARSAGRAHAAGRQAFARFTAAAVFRRDRERMPVFEPWARRSAFNRWQLAVPTRSPPI